MLNGTQFNTWEKHLNFHATLSQDNAVQSSAQLYDAFLKTLGTSSSTTLVVANAASLTNDISAINETSIAGHKPCLIHTSGKHTNDECFKQKDIRANSDMTSYKLIAALTKIYQENRVEHTRNQALKKQSQAVTLARSKSNPQKKKGATGQKPRSKSQDTSLPASPSKPSKRILDDDSTAVASKGSSKSNKKRKEDTASSQKAHMARQSADTKALMTTTMILIELLASIIIPSPQMTMLLCLQVIHSPSQPLSPTVYTLLVWPKEAKVVTPPYPNDFERLPLWKKSRRLAKISLSLTWLLQLMVLPLRLNQLTLAQMMTRRIVPIRLQVRKIGPTANG